MNHNKDSASSEPSSTQNVVSNTENDRLLASTDLFSGTSLNGRQYVQVPMSRTLARQLHINQLNEYCLLALFNQFPLQRQLQLRAVCRQWQAIIEQKCRGMRSLKLFGFFHDVFDYCHDLVEFNLPQDDQLKLKPIGTDDDLIGTLDQLRQCAHLFADITSFVYCDYYSSPNLAPIPDMFPLLTSLSLSTASSPFPILNSLPHLNSLHLHGLKSNTVIPKDIPILNQLGCFSLCRCPFAVLNAASLLVQLGPNFTRLLLSYVDLLVADMATVLNSNPSLVTSVTHLTIGYIYLINPDSPAILDLVCDRMVNLVYLHFDYIDLDSFPSLAKLQHLTELHVNVFLVPESIPCHLPSVSSVKQLHLTFKEIPTTALNLQTLFPAVETINIYSSWNYGLEEARKYMAQFCITCSIIFHKKNFASYFGRHR